MNTLTRKQALFVSEYLVDLNATQAAIRAGYSRRTADRQGHRLLKNAEIHGAVQTAMHARREHSELSEAWVLERLREVVDRCMESKPVLDPHGKPSGFYPFNAAGANRALELIGRHFGMFTDNLRISDLETLTDDELDARLAELDRKARARSH